MAGEAAPAKNEREEQEEEQLEDLPEILPCDVDAYHGVQIDAGALFRGGGGGGGGEGSGSSDDDDGDENAENVDVDAFTRRLASSLSHWRAAGRRGVWLKLPLPLAAPLFPAAIAAGFEPHHAEKGYVMLTQWLPGPSPSQLRQQQEAERQNEKGKEAQERQRRRPKNNNAYSKLPNYASHQVGVGAFVLNSRNEVLVVQEASGPLRGKGVWKMPTGLSEAGEDAPEAARREVLEETGLRATPEAVIAIRQAHGYAFGKSDLFFVVALRPDVGKDGGDGDDDENARRALESSALVPDADEIVAARWMPLDEYVSMDWLRSRPLWSLVARACGSYARGEYVGMPLRWLDNGHNGRTDLLVCGWKEKEEEGEEEGEEKSKRKK